MWKKSGTFSEADEKGGDVIEYCLHATGIKNI